MLKVVTVKFKYPNSNVYTSNEYCYKTYYDVRVGQEVVVETNTGYKIAMISRIIDEPVSRSDMEDMEFIVQIVDTSVYEAHVAHEGKLQSMRKALRTMAYTHEETALYEALAKEDEEFRELYLSYKQELERYKV